MEAGQYYIVFFVVFPVVSVHGLVSMYDNILDWLSDLFCSPISKCRLYFAFLLFGVVISKDMFVQQHLVFVHGTHL